MNLFEESIIKEKAEIGDVITCSLFKHGQRNRKIGRIYIQFAIGLMEGHEWADDETRGNALFVVEEMKRFPNSNGALFIARRLKNNKFDRKGEQIIFRQTSSSRERTEYESWEQPYISSVMVVGKMERIFV